jgi:hypothetical protein
LQKAWSPGGSPADPVTAAGLIAAVKPLSLVLDAADGELLVGAILIAEPPVVLHGIKNTSDAPRH